jgi:hypothetical protein
MRNESIYIFLAAFVALALTIGHARAGHGCCAHCGCTAECCKVCRLVSEEKKVEVFCYGCKCEEFCLACPSKPGCKHCECLCDECEHLENPDAPVARPKSFVWFDWFPGGAKIYTRTKLMRKTETVTVPSYKWVVEDLCPDCAAASGDESLPTPEAK